MFFFSGILIAKKPIFRRLNTCEPDGFFASSEHEKVSAFKINDKVVILVVCRLQANSFLPAQ